jgi:hypothetical protein
MERPDHHEEGKENVYQLVPRGPMPVSVSAKGVVAVATQAGPVNTLPTTTYIQSGLEVEVRRGPTPAVRGWGWNVCCVPDHHLHANCVEMRVMVAGEEIRLVCIFQHLVAAYVNRQLRKRAARQDPNLAEAENRAKMMIKRAGEKNLDAVLSSFQFHLPAVAASEAVEDQGWTRQDMLSAGRLWGDECLVAGLALRHFTDDLRMAGVDQFLQAHTYHNTSYDLRERLGQLDDDRRAAITDMRAQLREDRVAGTRRAAIVPAGEKSWIPGPVFSTVLMVGNELARPLAEATSAYSLLDRGRRPESLLPELECLQFNPSVQWVIFFNWPGVNGNTPGLVFRLIRRFKWVKILVVEEDLSRVSWPALVEHLAKMCPGLRLRHPTA